MRSVFPSPGRAYRHAGRYRQILTVLLKYGFGDIVSRIPGMQALARKPGRSIALLPRAQRLRLALEELGPTFIKMGQILSTRPDLIPWEFASELSALQDRVPPFPTAVARAIVVSELRRPIDELFRHFDETPLAAASIGQVHRATTLAGDDVIVKIQRPDIRGTVATDLEILSQLASLAERHLEGLEVYRPTRIVDEFARTLQEELDYRIEASHIERFSIQVRDNPHIRVPRLFREFSTERVLTLEYLDGIKVSDPDRLDRSGADRKTLAARGAEAIMEQIFVHGFYHADPHPGNLLVLPGNVIGFVDFGMMGTVDRNLREQFVAMIYGYVREDASTITSALLRVTEPAGEPDRQAIERDLRRLMDLYLYKPLGELRVGALLQELMTFIQRHHLFFRPDAYLVLKAVTQAESIGLLLDPAFDIAKGAAPIVRRIRMRRFHPSKLVADILWAGEDLVHAVRDIPGEVLELTRRAREGKLRLGFEHRGLEPLILELDRSSNRIAFSLMIASIVIGSSLIITTGLGPIILGYPVIGLIGYTVAALFGLWLLIAIVRSGTI